MNSRRTLAHLAASALVASGLAVTAHASASSSQHAHSHFRVVAAAKAVAHEKKVFGRTTYKGKGLLDVKVAAYKDGKLGSKPAASDLSYDYTGPEGKHRPGAFALRHLDKGTYSVVLKKAGFATVTVTGVKVSKAKPIAYLHTIKMNKPSPSSTKVTLSADTIKVGGKLTATVKVKADRGTPTGKVQLLVDGKKFAKDVLKAKDKGRSSFTVKGLGKGKHDVAASYAGSPSVKSSSAKAQKVTVRKGS